MITDIQNTRDIKIVRAVWGNMDLSTIPTSPQYNEIVYVWGTDNKRELDLMGYNTILCDKNNFNFKYASTLYQFMHKLIAIDKACNQFSKILFLDWDYYLDKNLDDNFFNSFNGKTFLVPIYSYSLSDLSIDENDFDGFLYNKNNSIKNYSWQRELKYIIPNAGFIYISNPPIGGDLLKIAKDNNLKTLIEEFSIYKFVDCNLENYIETYHPKVCFGRTGDDINNFVNSIIETDIYFKTQ